MAQQTRTGSDVATGIYTNGPAGIGRRGKTGAQVATLGYDFGYLKGLSDATIIPTLVITYPTIERDPLIIDVFDATGNGKYEVVIGFHNSKRFVAYNDFEGFYPPFDYRSTVAGAGSSASHKIITIYTYGPWPTNAPLDVAVDVVQSEH